MNIKTKKALKSVFRWEVMLLFVLALLCLIFDRRDQYLKAAGINKKDVFNLASVIKGMRPYMLYSFMTLGMMLILAMGDIDISTGATAALSVAVLGILYQSLCAAGIIPGIALALSILACLLTGGLCGALNGLLITRFKELFPMIITLATQLFFRGIAYLLLGGGTLTFKNDGTFDLLKNLYNTVQIGSISFPTMIIWFLLIAAVFFVFIHLMPAGRRIFALGANKTATFYSGIRTDRIKFWLFALCGLMSALTAIFFVGATSSSIRADSMTGYEMYAIAAAVLGGFSTSGGKGSVIGASISLAIFGVMKIGLGTLFGFADSMVNLSVGVILIVSTLLPNLLGNLSDWIRKKRLLRYASRRGNPA